MPSIPRPLRGGLVPALLLACACSPEPAAPPVPLEEAAPAALRAHSAEFEKKVYRVTDRVSVAVGYALANSILIEGDGGAVIVDVTETVETAAEVKAAFQEITTKPIRALVYTHNHADHVFGARGFVPEGPIDVFAHETTNAYIDRVVNVIRPIIGNRSARMFGTYLPDGGEGVLNAGIGPRLAIGHGAGTASLIRPNRTFRDQLTVEVAGVPLHLVHAPGETNDQIFIWLPEDKVLLPGDNVYKAFPNLYTIRGTLYRDVLEWSRSIDKMRALRPEHLVPSHGRPVSGADEIQGILTAYRDAIQFVHDQTIRGMNQGLTPDELVEVVKLPEHLREHPYLQEFYGTVEWSVRSVFSGYLGWFDGDSATLSPAPPKERSRGYVALAGGNAAVIDAVRQALDAERFAWAAELATHVLRVEPGSHEARALKARALRELGRRSVSPNGRHFYLTQALELEGKATIEESNVTRGSRAILEAIPIGNIMSSMTVNLSPEKSADVDMTVGFRFRDVGEDYGVHVRRGVAELQRGLPEPADAVVSTDTLVWKEIVTNQRNAAVAFASDAVEIEGSALDVVRFLALFRP